MPLRLGVIGKPSDWLIASQVDAAQVLERMDCQLVDVPIEEVTSLGEVDGGMQGAEAIYARLKDIIAKYDLQGVTLRCFDLLKTVKNTGCIALVNSMTKVFPLPVKAIYPPCSPWFCVRL